MRNVFLLLCVLVMLASVANAQNTPAPCSPANLQATDVKYGCYNTPDCVTGFMCFYTRVLTDVFYGTTCEVIPMYLCSSPNNPAVYKKEKTHAQVLLARVRAHRTLNRG